MRTAEEILKEYNVVGMTELMIPIINKAMEEAIRECLKNATIIYTPCGDTRMCGCHGLCERPFPSVNKKKILSLIDQLQ